MNVLGSSANAGLILGLRPANERRRYKVTTSLIGWAHAKIQPSISEIKSNLRNP